MPRSISIPPRLCSQHAPAQSCSHPHHAHLHSTVKHCRASAGSTGPDSDAHTAQVAPWGVWIPHSPLHPSCLCQVLNWEPQLQFHSAFPLHSICVPHLLPKGGNEMARTTVVDHAGKRARDQRQVSGSSPPSQFSRP